MKSYTMTVELGSLEVRLIREFESPAALVYRAYVDPEAIPRWWGPGNLVTVVDRLEAWPGGSWRFCQTEPDGEQYAFRGFYHQVDPGRRLVYTFEWEGLPGHILLETIDFLDLPDGRCRLVDSSVFQSVEDRDGMVAMGMETGAAESLERLQTWLREPPEV